MREPDSRPVVAVVDYGIGNLRSAQKALERCGAAATLTDDPAVIEAAAAVVLPGVGAFGACMAALGARGLTGPTIAAATSGRPFLGICVGMQMLFDGSDESPGVPGLGILPGRLRLLPDGVKRPQMQWNQVEACRPSVLLGAGAEPGWYYFVHSYAAEVTADTVGVCDYGGPVTAVVERGSVAATQFHPEKSGEWGLALLSRFVERVASSPATAEAGTS